MSWVQVERHLADDARLLVPVGAFGQHGPHLPLGTNTLIADHVAGAVSAELGILKAPPIWHSVLAPAKGVYPGQSGLRRKNLYRTINDLLAGWEDGGFDTFYLITAHRYEPHLDALLMAHTARARTEVINLYAVPLDDILDTSPVREHAAELETSLLLHLAPRLVYRREMPEATEVRRGYPGRGMPRPPRESLGVVGNPGGASADKGRAVFTRYVDAVVTAVSTR